ncbi:MAG TPA: DNA mismatch repair protein MutT [Rhodobacteraceae bacterium]|jgi:8-oxo-dGTP pyrophosphatase MutT (NUDIX family)|nr:DNA mismatch repair protein MutT [Paracoccaceae bacterium]
MDKTAIRHAATVIMVRDAATNPRILMGQRGAKAAFMPNKFVFPGGAVDAGDGEIQLASNMARKCIARLCHETDPDLVPALAVAAIREVWEETGLILGQSGRWPATVPPDWAGFAKSGYLPSAAGLRFVFRAITPPGRPRRFDARFFMVDAGRLCGDLDDFGHACDELSHLQWIALDDVRHFDLPFITEVVMAEVSRLIRNGQTSDRVPFFRNDDEESLFLQLGAAVIRPQTG